VDAGDYVVRRADQWVSARADDVRRDNAGDHVPLAHGNVRVRDVLSDAARLPAPSNRRPRLTITTVAPAKESTTQVHRQMAPVKNTRRFERCRDAAIPRQTKSD